LTVLSSTGFGYIATVPNETVPDEIESDETGLRPARRFLHLCYCCDDLDAVGDFFVNGLAMRNTMRTPMEWSSGELLGIDAEIESAASFVYDRRGPRTSPAIEIQGWNNPKAYGTPSIDPFEVGVKSLGFSVPNLDAAEARLVGMGCSVVHRGASPFAATWLTLRDPNDVMIDLVEDSALADGATQMRHLRITVTSLDMSLPFYDALGFSVAETGTLSDATFAGVTLRVAAKFVRLTLPDEPFEVILIQWLNPVSHGRHYDRANHAGVYRAALGVDDTRLSMATLENLGFVFDRHARLVELKGTPVPDMWITFISDPDGIPYEFVQRPRSAFR
jgi:catechol 2,3-dioxygenase-like lactoylglutathione lyase family enzyme